MSNFLRQYLIAHPSHYKGLAQDEFLKPYLVLNRVVYQEAFTDTGYVYIQRTRIINILIREYEMPLSIRELSHFKHLLFASPQKNNVASFAVTEYHIARKP
jgi:hypothetical protein